MKKTEKQDDEIIVRLTNFNLQRIYEALNDTKYRLILNPKENEEYYEQYKLEKFEETLAKIREHVHWY